MEKFFKCDECGHRMTEQEIKIISVPHPKEGHAPIQATQCPECGALEHFTNLCDEPDCVREATCGWPSHNGYRRTCGQHYRTPL